ncbi:MAG: hypothetical protein WC762_13685 [Methylobacter sp.]
MHLTHEEFGRLAGIVSFVAFLPYIIAILRRKTDPNRATWIIWSVVGLLLAWSYRSSGASHTIWVPVSYFIGPFIIMLLTLKYGEKEWTRTDKLCLLAAAVSVPWIFIEPRIALFINISLDFFGAIPTIKKAYHEPEKEDRLAWILWVSGNSLNLLAVEHWTLAEAAYPLYMGTVTPLILALLFRPLLFGRKKRIERKSQPPTRVGET